MFLKGRGGGVSPTYFILYWSTNRRGGSGFGPVLKSLHREPKVAEGGGGQTHCPPPDPRQYILVIMHARVSFIFAETQVPNFGKSYTFVVDYLSPLTIHNFIDITCINKITRELR